jgi:threonine/homoserine/homoserine lactone efflux protein
MDWASLIALLPFAFVMSITPGPNNLMVAASGVNFGFWRTVPHILGVTIGFPLMLLTLGFGLGAVIGTHVWLQSVLKYAGCGYLLLTAWQMVRVTGVKDAGVLLHPKSFIAAALFQWINPKAWMMGVSSIAAFGGLGLARAPQILVMSLTLGVMAFGAVVIWTLFGAAIAQKLRQPRMLRAFNIAMALLLVASLVPVFVH